MKNKLLVAGILSVSLLVGVHLVQVEHDKAAIEGKTVVLEEGNVTEVLALETLEESAVSFEAIFKRKVGDPETHHYTGVSLREVLEMSGIEVDETQKVQVVSIDQYTIEISYEELMREDHAYLVFEQNQAPLTEEMGPFMLVLKQDALSTRWNRQVTTIKVQ